MQKQECRSKNEKEYARNIVYKAPRVLLGRENRNYLGVLKGPECILQALNRQGFLHRPRGAVASDTGEIIAFKWVKEVSSPR